MKAAVLEGVGKPLVVKTVPDPVAAPGWAVVRLQAAAFNHRDLWIQQGQYAGLTFPIVLGSDGTGVVQAVGRADDQDWVGRAVLINPGLDWGPDQRAQGPQFRILGLPDNGTFAELIAIPVANLVRRPAHLAMEDAAALPLAGLTAWRALFSRGGLRAGEKVLVTGIGGGVALCALQFALAAGATVWVTSGSEEKVARARIVGATGGANYRDADWAARLEQAAGRFDLIVDSAMGAGLGSLIDLARPGGRIAFFGATTGDPAGLAARKVFFRQVSLLGTTMGSPEDFAGMVRLVEARRIVPVVDAVVPLDRADEGLHRLESQKRFRKIVVAMT